MRALSALGSLLRRARHDRRGQFAMASAIMMPVAIVLAAVAVDTGSLYLEKRRAQSLADIAAITAAANLRAPEEAVRAAFADNGIHGAAIGIIGKDRRVTWQAGAAAAEARDKVVLALGDYAGSPEIDPGDRFTIGTDPGRINAVRVTYSTIGQRHFGAALIPPPTITVEGTAAIARSAAFSIGSRLLGLEDGIANALLSGLTGSRVSLSVMDYNALVAAEVTLLSFLDALAAELDLTTASYSEVLDADVTIGKLARAIARIDGIGPKAEAAAKKLALQVGGAKQASFPLSRLIGLDERATRATISQVGAEVAVMELLTMGAVVAGRGRQVALDLGAALPGLLAVSADLAIGEPPQQSPWFAVGGTGDVVRTVQTRLRVVAEIGNDARLAGLLGARLRIPLYLELAHAEARLKDISCPTGRPDSLRVKVEARPGIANLYLAEVDPKRIAGFASPAPRSAARLVQLPPVGVTGQAQAAIAAVASRDLTFTADDIAGDKVRQVSTDTVLTSLTASLFSSLSLDVKVELGVLGIPLVALPPDATGLLGQTVGAAAPALDAVLNELLKLLGLSLGQADVRVHGATCSRAVLVQ